MANIVSSDFLASPQISPQDVAEFAAEGVTHIICNRPDGETPLQPSASDIEAACNEAGLTFTHVPMSGNLSNDMISQTQEILVGADKTLAYCASGTRSTIIWCFANVKALGVEQVITQASQAGYNLSSYAPMLSDYLERQPES